MTGKYSVISIAYVNFLSYKLVNVINWSFVSFICDFYGSGCWNWN